MRFPKRLVFYFLEYRTLEEVQEPSNSVCTDFVQAFQEFSQRKLKIGVFGKYTDVSEK
jgi:hypothetical protein